MSPIYLLGDHHGDYKTLFATLDHGNIRDAVVIHVGDGEEGYPGWGSSTARNLNKQFAQRGVEYLSIRGNHLNPHVFDGRVMLPNFNLLPDYSRLELNGQLWLFVCGAIDINRIDRILGETLWPQKAFDFRDDSGTPAVLGGRMSLHTVTTRSGCLPTCLPRWQWSKARSTPRLIANSPMKTRLISVFNHSLKVSYCDTHPGRLQWHFLVRRSHGGVGGGKGPPKFGILLRCHLQKNSSPSIGEQFRESFADLGSTQLGGGNRSN